MVQECLEDLALRRIIEAYDDAWNRHALDEIVACHSADSVFESHPTRERAAGHDAIRRLIARYFRVYPDLTFTIHRLYARPGLVVQEWTAHATHSVPILTRHGVAAPTGQVLTWSGVDILAMSKNLVARKDVYSDGTSLQRQIEVLRKAQRESDI
jgi:steroid delta-isomerase-like uncharacterized protein